MNYNWQDDFKGVRIDFAPKVSEDSCSEDAIEKRYKDPVKRVYVTYASSGFVEIPKDWGSEEIRSYIKRTFPKDCTILSYTIEENNMF